MKPSAPVTRHETPCRDPVTSVSRPGARQLLALADIDPVVLDLERRDRQAVGEQARR